jgi:Uncharacterized protein conserved in bacteria (DUF2188)
MHDAQELHVEPSDGSWLVVKERGGLVSTHPDRDSAIEAAVHLAQGDQIQIHLSDPEWGDASPAR